MALSFIRIYFVVAANRVFKGEIKFNLSVFRPFFSTNSYFYKWLTILFLIHAKINEPSIFLTHFQQWKSKRIALRNEPHREKFQGGRRYQAGSRKYDFEIQFVCMKCKST